MKKMVQCLLLGLIVTCLIGFKVTASSLDVNMVVTNPAEDMTTQINIAWHSNKQGTFVEYTKVEDTTYAQSLTAMGTCAATTFDTYTGTIHSYNQCRVTLTNLEPDTVYRYRVGLTNFTGDYFFRTAGGDKFRFIHVTDIHVHNPIPTRAAIANQVIGKLDDIRDDVAFTLMSGDMVAYGAYYDQWESLFGIAAAKRMPFVMTPGNHCYYTGTATTIDDRFFNAVTFNPQNGAQTSVNATYFFKYNNTLFISIDSEASTSSLANLNHQREWFKQVVRENESEFIVVYSHRPFYTGDSRNAGQASTMRLNWQTIFDETGVDLVFSGHNHVYARTHPVYQNNITTAGSGTTYIVGTQLGDRAQLEEGTPMSVVDKHIVGNLAAGSVITVEDGKMTLEFINSQGTVLDTAEIFAKSFTINQDNFMNSINLTRNIATPHMGTLNFANSGITQIKSLTLFGEDDNIIGSIDFPTSRTSIPINNIPLDDLTNQAYVEVLFRDGSTQLKSLLIDNQKYHFGTIGHIRVVKTGFAVPELKWNSDLENNRIEKFQVYVNGFMIEEVGASVNTVELKNVNRYQENLVELRAIDVDGDRVFFERFVYGFDGGVFDYLMSEPVTVMEKLIMMLKQNR